MCATLSQKSFLYKLMLYTAGKNQKGLSRHQDLWMDVPGSCGVSKGPRGHTELTPVTATEERGRESREQKHL